MLFSFKDKATYEESKKEYLMEREKYQKEHTKSGKEAPVKKKEPTIWKGWKDMLNEAGSQVSVCT